MLGSVNNELMKKWKEAAVAQSWRLPEGIEKTDEKIH
jgi:hypothetical protein